MHKSRDNRYRILRSSIQSRQYITVTNNSEHTFLTFHYSNKVDRHSESAGYVNIVIRILRTITRRY